MNKYTKEDVISWQNLPNDFEDLIGKEVFFDDYPFTVVNYANLGLYVSKGKLIGFDSNTLRFKLDNGKNDYTLHNYIIPIKETPKNYRPFDRKEILSVLGRTVIEKDAYSGPENKIISIVTNVDLMDERACVYTHNSWYSREEFLERFEFYNEDGTTSPCGVLVEEDSYEDL